MVRCGTGLKANKARRQALEKTNDLPAPQLLADNHLLVSEAAASTMSSYRFPGNAPHSPMVVSAAVPTGQVAACYLQSLAWTRDQLRSLATA